MNVFKPRAKPKWRVCCFAPDERPGYVKIFYCVFLLVPEGTEREISHGQQEEIIRRGVASIV